MTIQIDYDDIKDLDTALGIIKMLQKGLNNSYSADYELCPRCGEIRQKGWVCPECYYGQNEGEE